MNDILRIARLRIALQRAFLGRAILRVIQKPTRSYIFETLKPSSSICRHLGSKQCQLGSGESSASILSSLNSVNIL